MSVETKTATNDIVNWTLVPTDLIHRRVAIGENEFESTEFGIAIIEFLSGKKEIELGSITIKIPDSPEGLVQVGLLTFPYKEFVRGSVWFMQQGGRFADEHLVPLYTLYFAATLALEKELLRDVPRMDQKGLEHAKDLKTWHQEKNGIFGLRN